VHSLPGRLRLHLPGLRRVPEKLRIDESVLSDLLETIPAVHDVSWSYSTGNILVQYDHALLTEEEVIAGIRNLCLFLLERKEDIMNTAPGDLARTLRDRGALFISEHSEV
jgi:hypothetical protein